MKEAWIQICPELFGHSQTNGGSGSLISLINGCIFLCYLFFLQERRILVTDGNTSYNSCMSRRGCWETYLKISVFSETLSSSLRSWRSCRWEESLGTDFNSSSVTTCHNIQGSNQTFALKRQSHFLKTIQNSKTSLGVGISGNTAFHLPSDQNEDQ